MKRQSEVWIIGRLLAGGYCIGGILVVVVEGDGCSRLMPLPAVTRRAGYLLPTKAAVTPSLLVIIE